jgi:hypothetical protein
MRSGKDGGIDLAVWSTIWVIVVTLKIAKKCILGIDFSTKQAYN